MKSTCALYFLQCKDPRDNDVTGGATQDKPGSARGWDQNTWGRAAPLSAKEKERSLHRDVAQGRSQVQD